MDLLYVKTLHIIFVISWFAGLVYLPRIFVNLADETKPDAIQRLIGMAERLYRFMHLISIPAILLGFILWQHYGIGMGPGNKWLHAKLLGVILLIGYHHSCGVLLKKFKRNQNKRSVRWFKWFNEVPVIIVLAIIFLVVAKPF